MLLASEVDDISIHSCTLCMKMAPLCSPVVKSRCSVKHISINRLYLPVRLRKKLFLA